MESIRETGARRSSGRRRSPWLRGLVALAILVGISIARPATAASSRSLGQEFGLGLAAGFGTLFYFPLKMVYSLTGGLVGGLTYLVTLADEEVANAVWEPTIGGTYVLTPDMVAGDEPVSFIGGSRTRSSAAPKSQWPE